MLTYERSSGDPERTTGRGPLHPPVAGVIYLSVPFWFDRTRPIRRRILEKYYGSDAEDVWGVSYNHTPLFMDHIANQGAQNTSRLVQAAAR